VQLKSANNIAVTDVPSISLSRRKSTCWWVIVCWNFGSLKDRTANLQRINCVRHLPANVNINCRLSHQSVLPLLLLLRHIGIEIIHGIHTVLWVLTLAGRISENILVQGLVCSSR